LARSPVFFRVGVINVSGTAVRTRCTVPAGKPLFFPIVNNECSELEPAPFFAVGRSALAACNRHFMETATNLAVEIDGVPVRDLRRFRVCERHDDCDTVPIVRVDLPVNNVLGVPAGRVTSLGDGYYLLLRPLAPGRHTIHFTGTLTPPEFTFTLDIMYARLTIH
jgi:hypothetical protein